LCSILSSEPPAERAATYEEFAAEYRPFRNQVAVFAHVPAALRHLMPMPMELREAATLPKRYLEIAIVVVSKTGRVRLLARRAVPILTFRMAIKGFEAAVSSQRLPAGSRQPVALVRSLAVGGRHESRRARWSRRARRRRIDATAQAILQDETAQAILQQVGVEIQRQPHSASPPAASPRAPGTPRAPRFMDPFRPCEWIHIPRKHAPNP
jgi:hypothetical protein